MFDIFPGDLFDWMPWPGRNVIGGGSGKLLVFSDVSPQPVIHRPLPTVPTRIFVNTAYLPVRDRKIQHNSVTIF